MDRTKEFTSIVQLTGIPQYERTPINFYTNIHELTKQLDESIANISKVTSYESFRTSPLINSCSEILKQLKSVEIDEDVTRDHLEVVQNLKNLVKTNCLKYQLKLNEIKRKLTKSIKNSTNEAALSQNNEKVMYQNNTNELSQDMLLVEQEKTQQDVEQTQERKRILRSITEIGQIVEDISIHVRLQEEQLKRIDDIVLESDKWLKKTTRELLDYWHIVKKGRGRMVKYFLFFAVVILIFYFLRKI